MVFPGFDSPAGTKIKKLMPCISENIICVTVPELEKCGVSKRTLLDGLLRQRQGLVYCWEHHKIGNTVYIHYDGLKDKYKALIQKEICNGLDVKEWLKYNTIREYLPPVIQEEKDMLAGYVITREHVNVNTGEWNEEKRTGLPPEYISLLLYQSRWYRLMSKDVYDYHKHDLKKLNITGITDYRDVCIKIANSPADLFPDGAKLPKNTVACYRNQVTYEKEGILALISGKYGNISTQKVGDEQQQVLIDMYSDPRKPDFRRVTSWYNDAVIRMGWTTKGGKPAVISESCVKLNLKNPAAQQVWYLARHGYEAWKNKFGYTILRFRPSMRDAVWCGDGTKVNLYYRTPEGMAAKLNVYAIVDGYSGYWLGWDICEKEDSESVQRALRMAIRRSGYMLPFQMQYDGDSSNNYYKRMTTLHFPAMPNNGQSKIIERCFKTLQEGFMRSADEFTGMNITATSINSKVNKDFIEKLQKDDRLQNKQEAIRMQERFFHLMNNTKGTDGKTPKEKYFESINKEAFKVTNWDWLNLFWEWNERPTTYTKDGLIWTEGKVKKYYEVIRDYSFDFQNDEVPNLYTPDVDFMCKYIRQEFWVRFDPADRRRIALYKGEADGSRRFVAWAVEREKLAYAVQDYRENEREEINKRLEVKKEQKRRAIASRQAAADFGDSEEVLKLGYKWFDKETLHRAETDMYCDSIEEPEEMTVSETKPEDRKVYRRRKIDAMSKILTDSNK